MMYRTFRINGDNVSCWFSPEGSLSSAFLFAGGAKYNVVNQLPGLTEFNMHVYLFELGYTTSHSPKCIDVGRRLVEVLSEIFLVENVYISQDDYLVSVVHMSDRILACPSRILVAHCDRELENFRCVAIHDKKLAARFLSSVGSLG